MIVPKLALAEARCHWGRLLIAILTVGAAIALVVWSIGTVATNRAQHRIVLQRLVGNCDAWVVPDRPDPFSPTNAGRFGMQTAPTEKPRIWGITEETVQALRRDSRIREMDAYSVTMVQVDYRPEGRLFAGPRPRGSLTGTDAAECPYGKDRLEGEWVQPGPSTGDVRVVVSSGSFFRSAPPIGSVVTLLSTLGSVDALVVGHIRQQRMERGMPMTGMPSMFVSLADYEAHFRERTGRLPYDVAVLRLQPPGDLAGFHADWDSRLKAGTFPCRIEDPERMLGQMGDRSTAQFLRTAPLILGLAGVATVCIIITTLSLGLRQRLHTLAMLRAIGAERRHVFLLILAEGLIVAGLGCAFGILAGWVALLVMARQMPDAFPAGVVIDGATIFGAVICAVLGVAGAAVAPCIQAARMRPLDVLQELYIGKRRVPPVRTVLGILLLLPAPALALNLPLEADLRCKLLLYAALPSLVIGCVLVTPLIVVTGERLFGNLICRLAGLNPKLLSQPLSRQMGRAIGTAITISVGLGLYTAIETWGSSMTKPFLPSPGFPDVIASFTPNGLPAAKVPEILRTPGFREGQAIAFECEQFIMDDLTQDRIRENKEYKLKQNNLLLLGVDVEKAFGGSRPMFDLDFTAGNAREAARRLSAGGACVVPAVFIEQSRFRLGDRIGIRVPVRTQVDGTNVAIGERIENLEIVGVVDINWHLVTARAGLRGQDGNPFSTMSPVFVSFEQSRAITTHDNIVKFIWANLSDDLRALQVEDAVTELQNRLTRAVAAGAGGAGGARRPPVANPEMGTGGDQRVPFPGGPPGTPEATPPAAAVAGPADGALRRSGGGPGRGPGGGRAFVQVSHRDFVLSGTVKHADDIISGMSRVPLWALAILSLSIVNAVVASIQTRRVEIGRMRAIGLSRSQLLRLVCVEGILIGFAVALLSLVFGIESGWCFTGYTRGTMAFGGLPISFQLPWARLAMANLLALGLALAGAVVPAWLISRKEPASLLHSGAQS